MFRAMDLIKVEHTLKDRIRKDMHFTVGMKVPTTAMKDMIINNYQTVLYQACRDLELHYYVFPVLNVVWGQDGSVSINLYWKPVSN